MHTVRDILFSDTMSRWFPSAIAVPRDPADEFLYGSSAASAPSSKYDVVVNWKLLLGKPAALLQKERTENASLDRVLDRYSLDRLVSGYFQYLLAAIKKTANYSDNPQFIIGVPAVSEINQSAWRTNYRRVIENAFVKIDYPKPRFFPEPFAVFQYHWHCGDIVDTGRHQNVLVLDIGGGTTNLCLIQTTRHGRLARGGVNHIPHGVRSMEIGGSTIDRMILERLCQLASNRIRSEDMIAACETKEVLSTRANVTNAWDDKLALKEIKAALQVDDQARILCAHDLNELIRLNFWPPIKDLVAETLEEARTKKLANPVDKIDLVVFAGGTCQLGLIPKLFAEVFGGLEYFSDYKTLISPDYRSAVARGLAIEAEANSRYYDLRPIRIAPYLYDHLQFMVSHRLDRVEPPIRLRAETSDVRGNLLEGILVKAPVGVGPLIGVPLRWEWQLRQQPDEICYRFEKIDPSSNRPATSQALAAGHVKVSRRGYLKPAREVEMELRLEENGFARVCFETRHLDIGTVSHNIDPLDLHELSDLEGSLFFGVDFGTSTTLCSYVNLKEFDPQTVLPSTYRIDPKVAERARELEDEVKKIISAVRRPLNLLAALNNTSLQDYVYHSNRIEGSELERGQTQKLLDAVEDDPASSAEHTIERIRKEITFIDEAGEIRTAARPIRDGVAAVNLRDAFRLVEQWASEDEFLLSSFYIRQLHALVVRGDTSATPGRYRQENIRISQTTFVPPDYSQVESDIEAMLLRISRPEFRAQSAIIQAAEIHAHFVSIHPFMDGNGRVARLITNYFLWAKRLPGILLPWENRDRYYDALEECNGSQAETDANITDLVTLFCDLFEDSLQFLKEKGANFGSSLIVGESVDSADAIRSLEENVVEGVEAPTSKMDELLARLAKRKIALNPKEQYANWLTAFESVLGDVRKRIDKLSRAFENSWGGKVELREYTIIDWETYQAIRKRDRFSRTWYFRIKAYLPRLHSEELVFFFNPNSHLARRLDKDLSFTVSLLISRYDSDVAKYVDITKESWSRIVELVHNGSSLGVVLRESIKADFRVSYGQETQADYWFATLVEDLIINFGEVGLSESVS